MGLLGALRRPQRSTMVGVLVVGLWCAAGCVRDEGVNPPVGVMHFPIAALGYPAVDPEILYVASSNFDLLYNSGTVQSFDLDVLNAALEGVCGDILQRTQCSVVPAQVLLNRLKPSEAQIVEPIPGLMLSEVRIGSFSDGMAITTDGSRLYLPVRSDADLTYIDVEPATGLMKCSEREFGELQRCTARYRTGPVTPVRDITLPTDPVAVYTGSLVSDFGLTAGDYVLMAHRDRNFSLFVDRISANEQAPILVDTIDGLALELVTVTFDPLTQTAWIPSAQSDQLSRVQVSISPSENAAQTVTNALTGTLYDVGPLLTDGIDLGLDSREVKFDPRNNGKIYLASRSPRALVIAEQFSSDGDLAINEVIPVGQGPSRLQLAELETDGSSGPRLFAFVSCFDSREVHIVDVDLGQSTTMSTGDSGAFELVVDTSRNRVYIVDFRTSVVRTHDLEPLLDCLDGLPPDPLNGCAPPLLGLLGVPQAVDELQ